MHMTRARIASGNVDVLLDQMYTSLESRHSFESISQKAIKQNILFVITKFKKIFQQGNIIQTIKRAIKR